MKVFNQEKRCCVCGEMYIPFALESYEAQIEDAENMCKDCLLQIVDDIYSEESEDEEC